MALLLSSLHLKSGEVSILGLGPNTVTIIKPRRCRTGRWLQEVTCVIPPLRQSQIHLDHAWQVYLSFVSAVRPFFRHLMVTVVRAFLLPMCDVRVVFPRMLDGVTGRDHGTAIAVSVPIWSTVRWWWSEEWEVGSRMGEIWYLSTRHDWCVWGGFFWLSNLDFLPWQLGWNCSSGRVIRCKSVERHIPWSGTKLVKGCEI